MNTTERPVPRWAYRLAHAIPFLTLPSGLWRLGLVFGSSMGMLGTDGQPAYLVGFGGKVYVVCLTIFSELVALTAPAWSSAGVRSRPGGSRSSAAAASTRTPPSSRPSWDRCP